jgi:hypothetical protein
MLGADHAAKGGFALPIQNSATMAALEYISRGWKVIQLHDVTQGFCSCREGWACLSAGKHPIARAWQAHYLADAEAVMGAWAARPTANVGVVTGPASGLWVLDVDPDHDGDRRLAEIVSSCGRLPDTYTVQTGSGGLHYYFGLAGIEFDLGNSRGRLPVGLDVRGRGGYVVAPPSVSGRGEYSALTDARIAAGPGWLVDAVRPAAVREVSSLSVGDLVGNVGRDGHAYAVAAVRAQLAELATALPGMRNETAFKVGCRLVELARADWSGLDWAEAEAAFLAAGGAANVDGRFLDGEVWSVWFKAQRHVKAPAVLPAAEHLGTFVDWNDMGGDAVRDFGSAGQGSATGSDGGFAADMAAGAAAISSGLGVPVSEDRSSAVFEAAVGREVWNLRVRDRARELRQQEEFAKGWREPILYGSLADELALPIEETVWRVHGLLPAMGNAVVVAPRKAGKTTLIGALAKTLVDGGTFLGRHSVEAVDGAVGIFNYENTTNQQRSWLRDLGIENTNAIHVLHLRGTSLPLNVPEVRRHVVAWLKDRQIKVWIVDPYARAGQGIVLNENDNGQANDFTGVLDEIKAEAGVAEIVMPVHSSNKTEVETGMETARGAGRVEDWADAIWYLSAIEGQRFLRATGRDVEVGESKLQFDAVTRWLTLGQPGEGRKAAALERDARKVLDVLRTWPITEHCTQNDLQDNADLGSSRRVAAAVKWLTEHGNAWVENGPNRAKYHYLGQRPDDR